MADLKNVRVEGLNELMQKLDWDTLIEPAVKEEVVAKIAERWVRNRRTSRKNPGKPALGSVNNTLSLLPATQDLSSRVATTLNWPRTKGTRWQDQLVVIARAMQPRVITKAIERIEARFGA